MDDFTYRHPLAFALLGALGAVVLFVLVILALLGAQSLYDTHHAESCGTGDFYISDCS